MHTCDFELNEEAPDGLGVDLALVPSGVPFLDVLDLKSPLIPWTVVDRVVPHVSSVSVSAD